MQKRWPSINMKGGDGMRKTERPAAGLGRTFSEERKRRSAKAQRGLSSSRGKYKV